MFMCKSVCFFALCTMLVARPAFAQQPLTLDAAIDEALARNVRLASERAAAAVTRHLPAQQRALPAPMLDAQIWKWPLTTLNPGKVEMYMLAAEQTIPAAERRRALATVAEREADAAALKVAVSERDVAAEVATAYADLAVARRTRSLYADAVSAVRQLGDASVSRYAAARMGSQDVLRSVVEISRLHQELIDLTDAERRAESRLAALLGRDPAARIGDVAPPVSVEVAQSHDELLDLAETSVPELLVAQAEREVAVAGVALASAERRPDYVLRAGYMVMPGEAGAWTASAGISWPSAPWNKRRLSALDAEKRAAVTAADARIAEIRQAIGADVQAALISLATARARVELLRTTLIPQANQSLEMSRIAYTSGQVDLLEVVDNHRVHLAAEIERIRAEGAALQAVAALERAVGTRLRGPAASPARLGEEK